MTRSFDIQVDLRNPISTDISPFHIVLAVFVHAYAAFVHQHSSSNSMNTPEPVSLFFASSVTQKPLM